MGAVLGQKTETSSIGRLRVSKGVPKELEDMVRSKLSDLVNGEPGSMEFIHSNIDSLEREAIEYLEDIGAFKNVGTASFRVTARGRAYWEQLEAPRRYWYRQNWFPALVAGATIVAASASAAANIVNLAI